MLNEHNSHQFRKCCLLSRLIPLFLVGICVSAWADNPKWQYLETAKLPGATAAHSATILNDGKILVAGGYGKLLGIPVAVTMARLYDPATGTWQGTKGQLSFGRLCHAALKLPDGKVVLVGGIGQDKKPLRSIELYHPESQQFKVIAQMKTGREHPRLNLLKNGRVLITGDGGPPEILEINTDNFTLRPTRGTTKQPRGEHAVLDLPDGTILLIGGRTKIMERFDPQTEAFTPCKAALPLVLDDMTVSLLYNNKVLIAGGQNVYTGKGINNTWLYDLKTDTLSGGPTLNPTAPQGEPPGVLDMAAVDLFGDDPARRGRYIFLCGGEYDPGGKSPAPPAPSNDIVLNSAWVYDAEKNQLINVGPMPHEHDDFVALPLPTTETHSRVLIIAGFTSGDTHHGWCDIFLWPVGK